MSYRVSADIRYLDGPLADLVIPAGHALTFPARERAERHARFLARVRDEDDFVRAAVSGRRYAVVGPIRVDPI